MAKRGPTGSSMELGLSKIWSLNATWTPSFIFFDVQKLPNSF